MKTKKSTLFVVLALVATLVLSMACLFTACAPKEEKVMVTVAWDIPANVSVQAEGYTELPAEVEKDTQLVFTVTAPDGYTPAVKNGTTTVAIKDGKYTAKINKDTKISVTLSKTLNDIEVEILKDVTYFEDYKVDETYIKVTAKYALGDEVVTDYTISYPNGTAFVEGDTSYTVNFGGKTRTVEIAAVKAAQDFDGASLEVDADGNPVLVVTGHYNAGDDKAAAKTAVEAFAKECLERQTWSSKQYKAEATINDDNSFVLKLTVLEWTASPAGNHYYFRYAKNGVAADGQDLSCQVINPTCEPSSSNDNLSLTTYTGEPLKGKGGADIYIGICESWTSKSIMIVIVNAEAPQFRSVSLEVKNGKPYAVFNGTGTVTKETLLELIVHLDAEDVINGNVKPNGEDYIEENAIVNEGTVSIEIDEAAKTFKVYVLLEGENVKDGAAFFFHLGAKGSSGYYPNVSLSGDENASTITAGGLTFTFVTAADLSLTNSWQAALLYIKVTAAA